MAGNIGERSGKRLVTGGTLRPFTLRGKDQIDDGDYDIAKLLRLTKDLRSRKKPEDADNAAEGSDMVEKTDRKTARHASLKRPRENQQQSMDGIEKDILRRRRGILRRGSQSSKVRDKLEA